MNRSMLLLGALVAVLIVVAALVKGPQTGQAQGGGWINYQDPHFTGARVVTVPGLHARDGSCLDGFKGSLVPMPEGATGMQGEEIAFNPALCVAKWEIAPTLAGTPPAGETPNPPGGSSSSVKASP